MLDQVAGLVAEPGRISRPLEASSRGSHASTRTSVRLGIFESCGALGVAQLIGHMGCLRLPKHFRLSWKGRRRAGLGYPRDHIQGHRKLV